MQEEIGVGVIGMGWMGRIHAGAYRRIAEHYPDAPLRPRLVAASDISPERCAHAERLGFASTTPDWRAVVDDPAVDVISVTSPNALHREMATAVCEAGKHLWVEKPVGRSSSDTAAVLAAAETSGVLTNVGFCYRFAPAVAHARELIAAGAIGEITHFRGVFLTDYANRPTTAATWRFSRAQAGSGALGDLMAHVVDTAQFLVGPIERLSGRTAIMIPRRPRVPAGPGAPAADAGDGDLAVVDNEDWAAALFQFAGGSYGTLEASRVAVGPRVDNRFEIQGTTGSVGWVLERMNELRYAQLSLDGCDDGYKTVYAGPEHPQFAHFQPGAGIPMGYDDLRTVEAHHFLQSIADGEQREPGVSEMVTVARVLEAIERSHESGQWETPA